MIVSGLIIADRTLLDTFLRHFQRNMHLSVITTRCRQDTKFNCIQRHAGISAADPSQKRKRLFIHLGMITAKSFFHIRNRPRQKCLDIFFGEWMQFKNDGAGN